MSLYHVFRNSTVTVDRVGRSIGLSDGRAVAPCELWDPTEQRAPSRITLVISSKQSSKTKGISDLAAAAVVSICFRFLHPTLPCISSDKCSLGSHIRVLGVTIRERLIISLILYQAMRIHDDEWLIYNLFILKCLKPSWIVAEPATENVFVSREICWLSHEYAPVNLISGRPHPGKLREPCGRALISENHSLVRD